MKLLSRIGRIRRAADSGPALLQPEPSIQESPRALARLERMACEALAGGAGCALGSGANAWGRPVSVLRADTAAGAAAAAAGMGLGGWRSSAFLEGGLEQTRSQMRSLSERHVPLVVHAALRRPGEPDHSGYHSLSDCGLFQILPHSLQQALDFSLLAHWLAEHALVPGLVAVDRHGLEPVSLPSAQLVRRFLGAPEEKIEPPTRSQLLVFGEERRRVVGWFDLDKPVALSSRRGAGEGAGAAAGQRVFFEEQVAELAGQGMEKLARLTGRPLSFLARHRLDDADLAIVSQGAAFHTACAVADGLRHKRGWKVGALGLSWLRPFPSGAVREALARKRSVAVLECARAPFGIDPPLLKELRACGAEVKKWVSALYGSHGQALHAGEVALLVEELQCDQFRSRVQLGIESARPGRSPFPKRESLLEASANDYPALRHVGTSSAQTWAERPAQARSVQYLGRAESSPPDALRLLGETCSEAAGPFVWGTLGQFHPELAAARVDAAPEAFAVPEAGAALGLLLLDRHALGLCRANPFADLEAGGSVVIESTLPSEELWAGMPEVWRSEIRRLQVALYQVAGGFSALLEAAAALLCGAEKTVSGIDWQALPKPEADPERVPQVIRRVADSEHGYESLPRFWGEVAQPGQDSVADRVPDPLSALGAVPACSAALARPREGECLPILEAEKCTGCGLCWSACPDSAIGAAVVGVQQLLDRAADSCGFSGKAAGAVRRAHKRLASRIAKRIGKEGADPLPEMLQDAWDAAADGLKIADQERPEHDQIFSATLQEASRLTPVLSDVFYHQPEEKQKGGGGMLFLAVDPSACQGCGGCIAVCPEEALQTGVRSREELQRAEDGWSLWESLPDTSGQVVARTAQDPSIGLLPAILLSRHCSQAQMGGGAGQPGSGQRLSGRLTVALVEYHCQKQATRQAARAQELSEAVQKSLRVSLSEELVSQDSETLETALKGLSGSQARLADLDARLSRAGKGVRLDRDRILRLARLEEELKEERWKITKGVSGLGRSRFGIVVSGAATTGWAALYPHHPYDAPLVADVHSGGADLARGVAEGMARQSLQQALLFRRAALLAENPPDLSARLKALKPLCWEDLTNQEKVACPPLLLFADRSALSGQGLGSLERLLSCDLPLKIVLFDGEEPQGQPLEPALLAMADSNCFALCSSIAHAEHLASGLERALSYVGPALIHLYAPSPQRHGFPSSDTLERARLAVEARVHPLFLYDPSAPGEFGLRASLQGNPAPDSDWGEVSFVQWALGESRFCGDFEPLDNKKGAIAVADYLRLEPSQREGRIPFVEAASSGEAAENGGEAFRVSPDLIAAAQRRLAAWKVFQEIAGLESPFVERIRAELKAEIEAQQQEKFEALKQEYESRMAEVQSDFDSKMAAALRERLLTLAKMGPRIDVN